MIRRLVLCLALALGAFRPATSPAQTGKSVISDAGAYSDTTIYAKDDLVTDTSGIRYLSLAKNNRGNTPATSPSYWSVFTSSSGGGSGSGSGTVTGFSFSGSTLAPLFSCSVANPTSTPALSCTLASAAANTVFGNFTGSTAAPAFSAAPVFSAASLTNFPTLNQSTTGNAATATALAATPNLCPTGQAPTGIVANGNATGCAAIGGGGGTSNPSTCTASGANNVCVTLAPYYANPLQSSPVTAALNVGTTATVKSCAPFPERVALTTSVPWSHARARR
jgi:hypothetical protein